jgi:UDP-N-acetyl-D-mannosaminuronic acid dehydrogenase
LYKTFVTGECVIASGPRVAEMAKLTENSFRDVNIAFANELSVIADELDIDVWELISLANRHPRVNILQPGAGVGGHCIAVDPWFIVASAPDTAQIIRTAREVNDAKSGWVTEKVKSAVGQFLLDNPTKSAEEVVIVCYGLAFKPDIDDLRESPALEIARSCTSTHPGRVLIVEPNVQDMPQIGEGARLASLDDAQKQGDVHIILVKHREFIDMVMPSGAIIDAVGIEWK